MKKLTRSKVRLRWRHRLDARHLALPGACAGAVVSDAVT